MTKAVVGALRVNLGLDSAQFTEGLNKVQVRLKKVGASMSKLGAGMSVGLTAPIAAFGKTSVSAFAKQEKAIAAVEATLKSMGEGAGFTSKQLQDMASELQNASTFGDEDILSKVTANLLTFGNLQGDVFSRAQQMALDLSARLGQDLQSSAIQLGKALNDPVRGLTALSKVGVIFTDQQREQIKAMSDVGNLAGAQAVMLAALESQYAGQAQALRDTTEGGLKAVTMAWGDFQEQIGAVIAEFLPPLIDGLKSIVTWLQSVDKDTLKWGVGIAALAAALGPIIATIGLLAIGISAMSGPVALVIAGIGALTAAFVAFWPQVQAVSMAIAEFATSIPEMFVGLVERMVEVGGQIISGLWQGITAKFATVTEGVASLANGIVDSVKTTLRIQSPSKVFAEIGGNIVEGLAQGMGSMGDAVQGIAQSITQSVSTAFQGLIDGSKTVKEALADVMHSVSKMLADKAISAFIGGMFGGGGGIGLSIGSLLGFKNGGSFTVGGYGGTDSQMVAFRATPGEMVDVRRPGQPAAGGGVTIVNHNDFRGVDPSMRGWIEVKLEESRRRAVAESVGAVAKHRSTHPRYLSGGV